jgi:hypothetical protein
MTEQRLPSFEILQVANGFLVNPVANVNQGNYWMQSDVQVFNTWPEASKWLGDQFRAKTE